ncbi:MAG TPA: hypothetical protein PLJ60_00715 [Chryseolinea sp.]|nr:hypothetical protein [Chryseolinea sp.]HPH45858.1 hypothetical protein [Chryseolinea sp.]HPM28829.1 hypothetical protein [Chryseolinea sp.]
MKIKYRKLSAITTCFVMLILISCSSSDEINPNNNGNPSGGTELGEGQPGIVNSFGITAWDNLSSEEKNRIKGWNTIFMHQSVGADLEDGANNNEFKFEYFDLNESPNKGLSGNVFSESNGNPFEKINEFKTNALKHKSIIKIAIFKFGYADISGENMEEVKVAYKKLIDDLRIEVPVLRFVHITPPLVYLVTGGDQNTARTEVGNWMKDTFKNKDVIFDFQEAESDNGACGWDGIWGICNKYRSTNSCPSKSQGVDAAEGQGHLCETAATKISKAFLMSIYNAGK